MTRLPAVAHPVRVLLLLVALGAAGCGNATIAELREEARAALDRGDYTEATAICDRSLLLAEVSADESQRWFFERTRLDALAGQGAGTEMLNSLQERFQSGLAPHLDAPLYARLAGRLRASGDLEHAIETVQIGMTKFPQRQADFDEILRSLEEAARNAAENGDNTALEHLQQLGYLSR